MRAKLFPYVFIAAISLLSAGSVLSSETLMETVVEADGSARVISMDRMADFLPRHGN